MQNPTDPIPAPVFVMGALRSGSTLLALMMDRHPLIRHPGEFDFLFDPLNDGGVEAARQISAEEHDKIMLVNRIYQDHGLRFRPALSTDKRIAAFMTDLAVPGKLLSINIHRNFTSAHAFYPDAKFIHLVRDPRDCARSAIGMGWAGNAYYGVDVWRRAEDSWDALLPKLSSTQYVEIKYEDLVTSPQATLTRLCNLLGLEFSPAMLDLRGTTYSSPDAKFALQWPRHMSPSEAAELEHGIADQMAKRGYPLSQVSPRSPGIHRKLELWIQNQLGVAKHRIQCYGFGLWALGVVASRSHSQALARTVAERMNDIDRGLLK